MILIIVRKIDGRMIMDKQNYVFTNFQLFDLNFMKCYFGRLVPYDERC